MAVAMGTQLVRPTTAALLLPLLLPFIVAALPANQRRPGPARLDSRIGIVGAGPAGLHMAYLLRQLGFSNLLVLEAAGRVGGRSVTVPDKSTPGLAHELGTCYVNGDYGDLRSMAGVIGQPLDEVTLPEAVLLHHSADGQAPPQPPVPLRSFVFNRARQLDPSLGTGASDEAVILRLGEAAGRYLALRQQVFPTGQPDYMEFPMAQPPAASLARLNCTVAEFLATNGLMALEPYFLLGMTSMGYGHVCDTSALYGLMWMSPAYLTDLLGPRSNSRLGMLRRGFQPFWEAARDHLAEVGGVQFRLSGQVSRVVRTHKAVVLRLEDGSSERLDWLVWTPSVHGSGVGRVFEDLSEAEAAAFGGLSARRFQTQLVRLPAGHPAAAHPVAYYLPALHSQRPGLTDLLAVRNSAKALQLSDHETQRQQDESATLVAYYLSSYKEDKVEADVDAADVAADGPLDGGEVLAQAIFSYMPRFSPPAMADGALWRILHSVQGARRTWFAGHSVVFDSVKSVMKYNKMLLLAAFPDMEARLAQI